MQISLEQVRKIARKPLSTAAVANANSVLAALNRYGARFGLDQPHRLAQFLAQIMHESGEFRYDREVWGPTLAQEGYEGRSDLGNSQAGDGKKFAGRTGMQITGRANTKAFRDWCRKFIDAKAPDFLKSPDLMNTDPWEGLGPLWYWSTRDLNRYADQGDIENITRKINGGLNGFADRAALLERASLVLLGWPVNDLMALQAASGLKVDGICGPKTRAELHARLVKLTPGAAAEPTVAIAPVVEKTTIVEEKPVAVTPPELDKPVEKTKGFWERIATIASAVGISGATWLGDWRVILALAGAVAVLAILGLILHARIVATVKSIKQEIAA